MQRPPRKNAIVRGRKRHADPLQAPAQAQGLGLRDRKAINNAKGSDRFGSSPRHHRARDAAERNRVRAGSSWLKPSAHPDRRPHRAPKRSDAREREQTTAPILSHTAQHKADCVFNLAALHPAHPIKRRTSAQRT
jgi:hypothetical protein